MGGEATHAALLFAEYVSPLSTKTSVMTTKMMTTVTVEALATQAVGLYPVRGPMGRLIQIQGLLDALEREKAAGWAMKFAFQGAKTEVQVPMKAHVPLLLLSRKPILEHSLL